MKNRIIAGIAAGTMALAGVVIAKWEGTRYKAYLDSVGVPTICQGHTRGVKMGDTATPEQCEEFLYEDMQIAAIPVSQCITRPLPVHVLAALISASYNIGPKVVCGSTLQRKINSGDIEGGCRELLRWDKAEGKTLRGLTYRREDEYRMCWPDFSNVRSGSYVIY